MPKVLIADKMSPAAIDIFKRNNIEVDVKTGLTEEQLCEIIGEYEGLAVRSATKFTANMAKYAKKLKVVGRAGIGVDNVDQNAATANGVVVMNTPFGNSITTAEHTIALMLSLARKIPAASASTHQGKWEKNNFMGVEVAFKTLGLIGCGNIGSIVADRAKGLKMRVIAFDPYLTTERAADYNVKKVELDEIFADADFISLHTPLNSATKGIIDKSAFAKMKKGVRIVNCARGGLIVEQDLKEAIESGIVAGAALDVFEVEPATSNVLFGLEEIVCTPHLGASTTEAQEKVAVQLAEQITDYLLRGTITNALNVPSVSAEDAVKLTPYIDLGKQLGSFCGQLIESGIKTVKIEYEGNLKDLNLKPITSAVLDGLLSAKIEHVNLINAPLVAKERGIEVSEVVHDRPGDYSSLIGITVKTEKGLQYVAGTLFGEKRPRLVEVGRVKLEASLGRSMIYVKNEDKPGLIGNLGKILGEANVNIANFHLGRSDELGEAVALVEIDEQISEELLAKISKLPSVINARLLKF